MSEVVETVGRVLNGRLDLHKDAIKALNQGIKSWEGKTVRVIVRKGRQTRTDAQNRYLWGVCYPPIALKSGHDAEDLHELFKARFLPKELAIAGLNGEVVDRFVIGGSSTALNTMEFETYVERIRAWALDTLGVVVPLPGEQM